MGIRSKRIAQGITLGTLGLSSVALAAAPTAEAGAREGKYLVEEVGKCGDCHTPMTAKGPDLSKWLKGGPLAFLPAQPVPSWQKAAPDITSAGAVFKSWGEQGIRNFLMKGVDPSGNPANPPMPTYHMRQRDAEAIVEYLKTLK